MAKNVSIKCGEWVAAMARVVALNETFYTGSLEQDLIRTR